MATDTPIDGEKTEIRRFLFELSFDAENKRRRKKEEEKEEPPEPVFSLEQVDEARKQGYQDGRKAGLSDAANGVESEIMNILDGIAERLPVIAAEQASANELMVHNGAEVALKVVRKLMPSAIEAQGIKEIEALVSDCLDHLTHQPKISVRIAPQHLAAIEKHLNALVAIKGFEGRFLVEADADMAPTDCRITWPGGGVDRCLERVWRDIDASLDRFLATGPMAAASEQTGPSDDCETASRDGPRDQAPDMTSTRHADAAEEIVATSEPAGPWHVDEAPQDGETEAPA